MKKKDNNTLTYEQAVRRLEEISSHLETGNQDIDSLAANLQEAKTLLAFCKEKLTKVDQDIQKILSE